jgi:glutamate/tyrosine decarboxylase-like PLP-dependent enzyme
MGLAPFRAALSEKIWLARYLHAQLSQLPDCEVGPFPDLSVVIFRFLPKAEDADAFNQQLALNIQQEGRIFFSTTRIGEAFFLRIAICSFRTHLDEVHLVLEVLREHRDRLANMNARQVNRKS